MVRALDVETEGNCLARGRDGRNGSSFPPRADRLLLPNARLAVRGGGRRPGDVAAGLEGLRPVRGRAALRSWLYRIATNVCLDMLGARERRAARWTRPRARAGRGQPERASSEVTWIEPAPDGLVVPEGDPAEVAVARRRSGSPSSRRCSTFRRASAVLILCEVLRWQASEVAELLETSVASVNSASSGHATLDAWTEPDRAGAGHGRGRAGALARYVDAFSATTWPRSRRSSTRTRRSRCRTTSGSRVARTSSRGGSVPASGVAARA